jgi:hypothetical protein
MDILKKKRRSITVSQIEQVLFGNLNPVYFSIGKTKYPNMEAMVS